ncbi:MAG: toll/interleukin-1 receptor domain-containing protein [Planctomycetota bacterium]
MSRTARWDLFISHASEDKRDLAGPLAKSLSNLGFSVWYDEFSLSLSDSLNRSIAQGLSESRYGVVILSPDFFKKQWARRELDGLLTRDLRAKVIIPIWHNVGHEDVEAFSPILADKFAVPSSLGIPVLVEKIASVVRRASQKAEVKTEFKDAPEKLDVSSELRQKLKKLVQEDRLDEALTTLEDSHPSNFVTELRVDLSDVDLSAIQGSVTREEEIAARTGLASKLLHAVLLNPALTPKQCSRLRRDVEEWLDSAMSTGDVLRKTLDSGHRPVDISLLLGRCQRLEMAQLEGTITDEDRRVEQNRILIGLLRLLDFKM